MTWIFITILAYFLFSVVFLVDKYLLTSSIPNPKVYVFYVGALGTLAILLVPFTGFYFPENKEILLGILSGFSFICGLFWFFKGLSIYEASRVAPAVGGLIPLFIFILIFIASKGQATLSLPHTLAFLLLVSGSIVIISERNKFINLKSLKISALSAFLLSLSFVFLKYLFLAAPFWTGFILKSLGGTLAALCFFIIFPEIKEVILKPKEKSSKKTGVIFLANQSVGAGASILQNWAVSLAPLAYIAFINALQGIQYVFLLIFAAFFSFKFPRLLKEEISKAVIIQKIAAILLIGAGLALLAIKQNV